MHNIINAELIEDLQKGNPSVVAILYSKIASSDNKTVEISSRIINNFFKKLNTKKLLKISEEFRQRTSMDYYINWSCLDISQKYSLFFCDDDYLTILKLGTFHCNGYYRERCLKSLMNYDNTIIYAILRLNDWVEPIREYSYKVVLNKINTTSTIELIKSIPFIDKVYKSSRRNQEYIEDIISKVYDKINSNLSHVDIENILNLDYYIRKSFYNLLCASISIKRQEVLFFLQREKNAFCKGILMDCFIKNYECSLEQINRFLCSKSSIIRKKALWYKYDLQKDYWPSLEEMLFDKCKSIREDVCYILKKHATINILDTYINGLTNDNLQISILGIGENGTAKESNLIMPYLDNSSERVVKCTILSLSKLLEYSGYDLYFKYILDNRQSVSKAAYLSARNNRICYGGKFLYENYKASPNDFTKKYIILLLLIEDSWERLPYLIKLYNVEDLYLQEKIRNKILLVNPYIKITQEKAEFIRKTMNEENIPDNIKKSIEFQMKYSIKE